MTSILTFENTLTLYFSFFKAACVLTTIKLHSSFTMLLSILEFTRIFLVYTTWILTLSLGHVILSSPYILATIWYMLSSLAIHFSFLKLTFVFLILTCKDALTWIFVVFPFAFICASIIICHYSFPLSFPIFNIPVIILWIFNNRFLSLLFLHFFYILLTLLIFQPFPRVFFRIL